MKYIVKDIYGEYTLARFELKDKTNEFEAIEKQLNILFKDSPFDTVSVYPEGISFPLELKINKA